MMLPDGFAVRLADGVRVRRHGRVLVGGAPTRVARPSARAREVLASGRFVVTDATTRALADHLLGAGLVVPAVDLLVPVDLAQVTAVVPVLDDAAGLDRLLSLWAGRVQTVVVDDGSARRSAIARTTERHGARLVRHELNRGPAAARNTGLESVETRWVVFVDADALITPDELERLLRHFADPRVALVAPRISGLVEDDSILARYESACSSLDRGSESALVVPGSVVAWLPSAVLAARVDALGTGFDASMRSGEDVDLVWRTVRAGWRVRYDAQVTAGHDHRTRPGQWWRRRFFYGTSAAPLARRHGAAVAPAILPPLGWAVSLAVLAQRRWSIPAALAAGAVSARDLNRRVGDRRVATELAARGGGSALAQTSGLMLRHLWPLTVIAMAFSRRARRAVAVAALVDAALAHRRHRPQLSPWTFMALRRADDVAYGAGVWAGAWRHRSIRGLMPARRLDTKDSS